MPEQSARVPRTVVFAMWAAAVLTVAALVGSALLREVPASGSAQGGVPVASSSAAQSQTPAASINCGAGQCREFASTTVGNTKVSLLADTTGGNSFIRFTENNNTNLLETRAGDYGGKVDKDSLTCLPTRYAACLVTFTGQSGGQSRLATLWMRVPGRTWTRAESQVSSEVGVMQLKDVDDDGVPEVLAADGACSGLTSLSTCKQFTIRGYNHEGTFIGCTPPVRRVEQLDGWRNDLRATKDAMKNCKS